MRLIKPSFEIIEQKPRIDGLLQHIERCGRTCYKSEDKITEDSAEKFVNMIINRGHTAMLEHGTVYLKFMVEMSLPDMITSDKRMSFYENDKYSEVVLLPSKAPDAVLQAIGMVGEESIGKHISITKDVYVTTNYRVLLQNDRLDDLQYLCEPTEYHVKRVTVKFVCDRGVSHEFVRHRVFSFAQESTRYCNYSKDKFGNECTFIIPSWLSDSITREGHYAWHCWCGLDTYGPGKDCFASEEEYENRKGTDFDDNNPEGLFIAELQNAEFTYFKLLEQGWIAQQARAVLPNSLKTELVMTGFIDDWWGEYLIFNKETGELIQRIHGSLYESLYDIDRDKYRIVESGFFPLRCSKGAHPQAYELAQPLREEFIKRG